MRILHLADLHIGKQVNEFPMMEDQRYVLAGVLELIAECAVDALVLAGDLYDKAAPSAEAVALLDWFLSAVAERGVAVLAVAGNHDSAERVAYGSALLAKQGVYVSPVYDGHIEPVVLEDAHGPVAFWLIPFLRPAAVRPHFPDAEIRTYTDALRCAVDACAVDPTVRNVAVAHQFVTAGGAELVRSDSETVTVGGIDNVDAGVFAAFDYVALGHIHAPQQVGRPEMRYAGSPLAYSFSERAPKTAPLVTLGEKHDGSCAVDLELLPLEPLHALREIKGPLVELIAPEVVEAAPADDYLHVTLTDEEPPLDALAQLRAAYPNLMVLDVDNTRTRAAGAEGAVADVADEKTPLEHFRTFYELQNGRPLTPAQEKIVTAELNALEPGSEVA